MKNRMVGKQGWVGESTLLGVTTVEDPPLFG